MVSQKNYKANFVKLYDCVELSSDVSIDEFCSIGYPSAVALGKLVIGANAKIRSHSVVYEGSKIGSGFHLGHGALVRENCEIGSNVSIGSHSVIEHHVKVGDNVRMHSNVFVSELSILENDVWLGPGCTLTNSMYPNSPRAKQNLKGVHILEGAILGADTIVLPGVKIGKRALIGAGSIIKYDVEDEAVIVGSPGRKLKHLSEVQAYNE